MGIGPLIAWRRASLRGLGRTFAWPLGVAVLSGLVLLALGAGSSIPGLVGYTFCAFVLASIVLEFTRGTRARRALTSGSWPAAFAELVGRNRRRYGGYVVHSAIVLLAIGVIGSSAYDTTREQRLRPGESMSVRDYKLTYLRATRERGANAVELRAVVDVERDGKSLGTLRPGKNSYLAERQVSNEAAIRSDRLNGEDLFLIAEQLQPGGPVFLKVLVKPLVNLIWVAGFVFVGGALIALWPDAREQRRLALRYGRHEAIARA
jgi:cytochrome c-type biogenesis protein CcmF